MTYVQAYWRARAKRTQPQPPVQRWDEKTAPMVLPREGILEDRYPRRNTMTGKIAVALVIVSGPGHLAISQSEKDLIVVKSRLDLSFGLTYQLLSINYHSAFSLCIFQSMLRIRDPITHMLMLHSIKWVTVLVLLVLMKWLPILRWWVVLMMLLLLSLQNIRNVILPLPIWELDRLSYMQYSNDGWGPNQIDKVFAHETGHVFHAPDEYRMDCNCDDWIGYGIFRSRNYNCVSCLRPTPSEPRVPCIMDSNTFSLCRFTKAHIGWCDG